MTPFQRKIKSLTRRKYLPELFHNLPPRLEEGVLQKLVIRLREGDKSVINTIVEGHLRLGMHIAARYGSKYPNKVDDIIGEMQVALTKSTKKARYKLRDNVITPYLVTCIHSAIMKFIEEDHIVCMPARTMRSYVEKCNPKLETPPKQVSMMEDRPEINTEDSLDGGYDPLNNLKGYVHVPQIMNEELRIVDVNEIIDKVTKGYIEKRVIELRAEGHSYEEIGPRVGCSVSKISIIVRSIEEKFNELYGT